MTPPTPGMLVLDRLMTGDRIRELANQYTAPDLVKGLIPTAAVTLITGNPKAGKTTIYHSILDKMENADGSLLVRPGGGTGPRVDLY